MKMKNISALFCYMVVLGTVLGITGASHAAKTFVYVGTYTGGSESEGIYVFEMDDETGKLNAAGVGGISTNPSFLTLHPEKNLLFAVGETRDFNDAKSGSLASFKIDPASGKLAEINRVASSGGSPCHIVTDKAGKHLLVANYHGGNVASITIGEDGKLGKRTGFVQHEGSSVNPKRQEGPHAHSINLDRANQRAFAADLGTDELIIYDFDKANGSLKRTGAFKVAPGSGPRHLASHPKGKHLYLLNEILSTVDVIGYDPDSGTTTNVQTISTLPEGFEGNNGTAEVQITPDGKYLYASNRGHGSLACFKVDQKSGKLTLIEIEPAGGKSPRNFGIHPNGNFIIAANQHAGTLRVFAIDQKTGELTDTGHAGKCPQPVCITYFKPR